MLPVLPRPFGPDLKVLVLAGGNPVSTRRQRRAQRRASDVPLSGKAFLPLQGRLVIEHVLDWLRECGLERVWVLAAEHHLARIPSRHAFSPVPQRLGARLFANLSAGYAALRPEADEPVLVLFGDHPLGSGQALRLFLSRCAALLGEADFFHALALRAPYREYAPWFRRTSVHLRGMTGRASGLNLAVPSRLHRLPVLDEMYAVRKLERLDSFFGLLARLTRWLGWRSAHALFDCVLLYAAKEMEKAGRGAGGAAALARRLERWLGDRVPARRLEGYVARILQAERGVRLIPVEHGGIAIDVDYAEELAVLQAHWAELRAISARQDAALRQIAQEPSVISSR